MRVFDATPLIYLATVERLSLVVDHVSEPVVPDPVHQEVVEDGIEAGHADARRIERSTTERFGSFRCRTPVRSIESPATSD